MSSMSSLMTSSASTLPPSSFFRLLSFSMDPKPMPVSAEPALGLRACEESSELWRLCAPPPPSWLDWLP